MPAIPAQPSIRCDATRSRRASSEDAAEVSHERVLRTLLQVDKDAGAACVGDGVTFSEGPTECEAVAVPPLLCGCVEDIWFFL
jgi:hypothetical protein